MSYRKATQRFGAGSEDDDKNRGESTGSVRERVPTWLLTGLAGAALLVNGVWRYRSGDTVRGAFQTGLGGILIGIAASRRRESMESGVD